MKSNPINISEQFNIPVNPKVNFFFIDEYLRMVHDPVKRKNLISTYGATRDSIRSYESENNLPHGAFDVAVMAEDERVIEMSGRLAARLAEGPITTERLDSIMKEAATLNTGISRIYPEAVSFLTSYQKNQQSLKERHVGNFNIKPIFAQEGGGGGGGDDSSVNINTAVNVNIGVNLNVFLNANVHVFLNLISVAVAIAAVVLLIAVAIF